MRQRRLDERVDAGRSAHRLYLSPPPLETQCICDALGMIHQRRERLAAIPAGATAPLSHPPWLCVRARSLYAAESVKSSSSSRSTCIQAPPLPPPPAPASAPPPSPEPPSSSCRSSSLPSRACPSSTCLSSSSSPRSTSRSRRAVSRAACPAPPSPPVTPCAPLPPRVLPAGRSSRTCTKPAFSVPHEGDAHGGLAPGAEQRLHLLARHGRLSAGCRPAATVAVKTVATWLAPS